MISRHASTPSFLGIMTSITITSGDSSVAALTASSPSLACPTTSNSPDRSSITWRPSRMIEWSSASSTLMRPDSVDNYASFPPRAKRLTQVTLAPPSGPLGSTISRPPSRSALARMFAKPWPRSS